MWTKNFKMFKLDLKPEKPEETRDQIANIHWIIEKAREFQKNICFIDYGKAFDCVDHNKLWKILSEMGILDNLTCLLRNLYTGQEAEAEAPILWPPYVKSQLIRKDPDAGKDWGQKEKRVAEDEMVKYHHNSMDMNLSKLWEVVKDREA